MSTFIPYQVDHSVKNTAKTLGFSKKKVIFKFGFGNPNIQGATGAACRGSEHEVSFLWSLKTGKRQLFLDGKDIHFSESGQNGWTADRAFVHAFTIQDGPAQYRVQFISQPKNPEIADSKAFDLRIAGVSYFNFNKIFQLGTPSMTVRENRANNNNNRASSSSAQQRGGGGAGGIRYGRESPMTPEERRQVAMAKVESIREIREQHQPVKSLPLQEERNLLDFDETPMPTPQPILTAQSGGPYGSQMSSSITLDSAFGTGSPQQQYAGSFAQQPPQPEGSFQQSQSALSFGHAQNGGYDTSLGQTSFPSTASAYGQQQSFNALTPYQPPAGAQAPSSYALGGGHIVDQAPFGSPGQQSYVSYGSAPSFAQPPSQATASVGVTSTLHGQSSAYGQQQSSFAQPVTSAYDPATSQGSLYGQQQQQPLFGQATNDVNRASSQGPAFGQQQPLYAKATIGYDRALSQGSVFGQQQQPLYTQHQQVQSSSNATISQGSLYGQHQPLSNGTDSTGVAFGQQPTGYGQQQVSPTAYGQHQISPTAYGQQETSPTAYGQQPSAFAPPPPAQQPFGAYAQQPFGS
jgi:hypothetical protein